MTRQSNRSEMIRGHRESFYVMKQRNVTARKLARRIMKGQGTPEGAEKLERMLQRGAQLDMPPAAMQALQASLKALKPPQNTKEG
mgnify:CR=1 FL=1